MNKTELVATVAEVSGKPKADVKEVLEALLGQIIKTVSLEPLQLSSTLG